MLKPNQKIRPEKKSFTFGASDQNRLIGVLLGSITMLFVPLIQRMCWTKGYAVCVDATERERLDVNADT